MRYRLYLIFATLFLMSAAHAADIGLSPPNLEIVVPRGTSVTESVSLFSTSSNATDLTVSDSDWTQSESGRLSFVGSGADPHSASAWLTLPSSVVQVPAKSSVDYRFSVTVPDDAALEGTYKTVIFFETGPSSAPNASNALLTRQRLGLILYVTVAGTERNGSKLVDMYGDGNTVHAIIANQGNTVMRFSGTLEVRDSSGTTVTSVPVRGGVALRESQRDVSVPMPDLPKGYYVLLLLLKDSRGGLLTGQLPYEVK